MNKIDIISQVTMISSGVVQNVLDMLGEGATIPFIARYRKERTGALNEVKIEEIQQEYNRLTEVEQRRQFVFDTISELGMMTDDIAKRLQDNWSITEIEDIYLPFKQKKRTKATIAKEAGLEPLAKTIMSGKVDARRVAINYVNDKIESPEKAIEGAQDIIAEWVNESISARNAIRAQFENYAVISCKVAKGKEVDADNYSNYFDKEYRLSSCPSHALLAMRRGEDEKLLKVSIDVDKEKAVARLERIFLKPNNQINHDIISEAIVDAYKRLLKPSIENEFAAASKEKADDEAIKIFSSNLRQLLLSSPLGQKRTMGIDPGFRTGCKVVCLDAQGNLLHNDTIYPHPPKNERALAAKKITTLVEQYKIEAIAIGNGTAGRETEEFIQKLRFNTDIQAFVVSESGASIYSASAVAREEFPDYDVTVRGAVSIGRRLMDPLAELVKIEPKSIGVGQYQHDVNQNKLQNALDNTVVSCVNAVGVEVNNASKQLLTYVSGIGPQLAKNIVDYRVENGAFPNRKALLKVPKMGPKSFEQCAGFLRVANSDNPLDNSAVHPERYKLVELMATDNNLNVKDLIGNKKVLSNIDLNKYLSDSVGMPTLTDIVAELEKPCRDPRVGVEQWGFDPNIKTIDDIKPNMVVDGIVTNVTQFGAFVNIGIKENGLLHVSQMSNKRIASPLDVVSVNQHIKVKIIDVDLSRKRISLSLLFEN